MVTTPVVNPTVTINNNVMAVDPNSVEYDEGLGEQNLRIQSLGGKALEAVPFDDISTHMSTITIGFLNTVENITLIRSFKSNSNKNVISLTGDGGFSRSFNNAIVASNYTVPLSSDGSISVEFKSTAAI